MRRPSLAATLIILALPALAVARPRVAILTIDGDPGGQAHDMVSDLLDGDAVVVGPKEINRKVDKLGIDADENISEPDLKKLAKELDADAIVQAKLSSKGG